MPCSACQRGPTAPEQQNVSSNASRPCYSCSRREPPNEDFMINYRFHARNNGNQNRSNNAEGATSSVGGPLIGNALRNSAFIDPANKPSGTNSPINPSTMAMRNIPITKSATDSSSQSSIVSSKDDRSVSEMSDNKSSMAESSDTDNLNSSYDPRDYAQGKDALSVETEKAMMGFVTELTERNFESSIRDQLSFVKYFIPSCGHCARLMPLWDELARKFELDKSVKIAEMDCHLHDKICEAQGVDGYPSLYLYRGGKKIAEYEGKRNVKDMIEFVEKNKK